MNELAWRTWAEQMATGLVLVDSELRLRWVNPALTEWLELGLRSPLGQPLGALLGDEGAVAHATRVLSEQRPAQWRGVALAAASGRQLSADIAVQPFDDGLLLEVHALAEPAASSSPLSATLRGFAHEVKNPLAGLRGAAQLLQRRVDSDDLRALAG
ncbi:MAG TPA: histidine kinase dimerization/phospho-acceptor domain-containing protein, partial [Rhodanobacteraceae bacterium]|nr:histidine kinase dimerization/phospho-acceptor domain-containing protein [Rhodanobacteraceae bacterium]